MKSEGHRRPFFSRSLSFFHGEKLKEVSQEIFQIPLVSTGDFCWEWKCPVVWKKYSEEVQKGILF